MISLGAKSVWTLSVAILDTGAGASLNKEDFDLVVWDPEIENLKAGCLWPTSSAPMKINETISLEYQMRRLHKKIVFLAEPSLAANVIFDTAFIGKYVDRIRPKANIITLQDSSPVAIVGSSPARPNPP